MVDDLTPEVKAIALTLMEGLACPRSLMVKILIENGEWAQISNLRTDPHLYLDSESYWKAVTASSLLRKYAGLPTGIDLEAATIQKWYDGEKECFKANRRLEPYLYNGPFEEPPSELILDMISQVRKEVLSLIGHKPPNILNGKFGPGATLSDKSRFTTVNDKLSSSPSLTFNSWPHLIPWSGTEWAKSLDELNIGISIVEGNHYFSVHKDSTINRACAKEPSLLAYWQSACGSALRKRLKHNGIDIRNGQELHKRVACLASLDASYCTIDLSNASDTICTNFVKLVLPEAWFELLNSLRSPKTFIEGKWVLLEKFSSMGNGFTFELETALFCAVARAAQNTVSDRNKVLTYGDDILVPNHSSREVIALLKWFGFTPNKRKTFDTGNFRESCGGDFFNGIAVRPYYIENEPTEPQDYISIANGLRRLFSHSTSPSSRADLIRRAWFRCLDFIPSHIRCLRGPSDLGDSVIHDAEKYWITRWRSNCIRYIRCYRPSKLREVRWEGFAYATQMAGALYLAGSGPDARNPKGNLTPRDAVLGYKVGWTPFS